MMTGMHVVSDIFCKGCLQQVGWTYIKAENESEKYKVGKFVIERFYLNEERVKSSVTDEFLDSDNSGATDSSGPYSQRAASYC
mmetsp:Transcript_15696/g.13728  ORF Transcript_15696/g.13728 Transcript_15696/m.13728 type:complete len:83 (+) Transcript_15696:198-446(+)